jgi:transcription elongation factor Elf1
MSTEKWKREHVNEMRKYRRDYYHHNKEEHYERNRRQRNKIRSFIKAFKRKLKCEICGEKDSRCLDFHHKNPRIKESAISRIFYLGWSVEHLKKEIAKCAVICSNCHRKKHICKLCNRFKTDHSYKCRFYLGR